jgi:HAD superfamily hydrolase (TIGR01509 family)
MLRGIVFDMDGVIVNSHPAHREAWQKFLRTVGKDVSDADLDFILEGRKRQDILRHFLGELSEVEVLNYGNKKDEFFREIGERVQPVAGVVEFLAELAQAELPAAVATSASKQRTRFTLRKLNLSHHFRAVVTGDDVAEGKPSPAIYQTAAARLGLPAQNLLAIEDSPCGVQAARAAGMHCIGIGIGSSVESLRQAGAEPVIQNFVGLSLKTLKRILPSNTQRLNPTGPTSTVAAPPPQHQ